MVIAVMYFLSVKHLKPVKVIVYKHLYMPILVISFIYFEIMS